jgi:hypothetical protein
MSLPTIIALNALLDLGVVLAILAVVRHTHRLHHHEARPSLRPAHSIALVTDEAEELARAA